MSIQGKERFRRKPLGLSLLVTIIICLFVGPVNPTEGNLGGNSVEGGVSSDETTGKEILIVEYPRIVKLRAGTLSRPVVTFTVTNNTGHPMREFSLSFIVAKTYPEVSFVKIAISSDEVFDKSYNETSDQIVYSFCIRKNAEFPEDQEVDLICVYEDKLANAVELDSVVLPKPYGEVDKDYDRINDLLSERIQEILLMAPAERPSVSVLVMLKRPVIQADLDVFVNKGGSVREIYDTIHGFSGEISADSITEYVNDAKDTIDFVDPDLPVEFYVYSAIQNTRAGTVWNAPNPFGSPGFTGDARTSVAIIDTGVDDGHPVFGGWTNPLFAWSGYQELTKIGWGDDPAGTSRLFESQIDELIEDYDEDNSYSLYDEVIRYGVTSGIQASRFTKLPSDEAWAYLATDKRIIGWKDSLDSSTPEDWDGHGTRVAGVTAIVAPNVRLVIVAMREYRAIELISALEWINEHKEDYHIVAVSLSGGLDYEIPSLDRMADAMVANGLIFIIAVGNGFWKGKAVGSPGSAPKVITVGAVDSYDSLTSYSSNGEDLDLLTPLKPDVVAPGGSDLYLGGGIISAYSNDISTLDYIYNAYLEVIGTSYAAPHVAGEVALIIDAVTDYEGNDSDRDGKVDEDPWNGINDDGDYWSDDPAGTINMYDPGIDEVFIDVNKNNRYDEADTVLFSGRTVGIDTLPGAEIFPLIDEDLAPWSYTEEAALRVKAIVCMASFEVHEGEIVPALEDIVATNQGTSNAPRDFDNDGWVDRFDRGGKDSFGYYGKDQKEGYGRISIDGAIEAVTKNWSVTRDSFLTGEFGPNPWDKKIFVRRMHISNTEGRHRSERYQFELTVPDEADYDLYIYDGGNPMSMKRPYRNGDPKIVDKSTNSGLGEDEEIFLELPFSVETYYLVVKWVKGRGRFALTATVP